jgi:hypothetical protein
VPLEPLQDQFANLVKNVPLESLNDRPEGAVRDFLAQKLYRKFQVNVPVLSARLKIEKLYPIS